MDNNKTALHSKVTGIAALMVLAFGLGVFYGYHSKKFEAIVHVQPQTIEEFAAEQVPNLKVNLSLLAVIHRAGRDEDAIDLLYPLAQRSGIQMINNIRQVTVSGDTNDVKVHQLNIAP